MQYITSVSSLLYLALLYMHVHVHVHACSSIMCLYELFIYISDNVVEKLRKLELPGMTNIPIKVG